MQNSKGPEFKQESWKSLPIISIIDDKNKDEVIKVKDYLNSITLKGDYKKKEDVDLESKKLDKEALDFLKKISDGTATSNEIWGYMLYDETGILKKYWSFRVGKNRKNKSQFFDTSIYQDWLMEIYEVLSKHHSIIKDPLYYFKLDDLNRKKKRVGNFDIMNSFRTWWNMYCLNALAWNIMKREDKPQNMGISIESSLENNKDKGNHLLAEISINEEDSKDYIFSTVEDFLKSFTNKKYKEPLSKTVNVSCLDILRNLIYPKTTSISQFRNDLRININIQNKSKSMIENQMNKFGINVKDLTSYLKNYSTVANNILNNKNVSYKNYL